MYLQFPNFYQFPTMFRIDQQAKFLARKLPVTLCQAREMVSFYYGCTDWTSLKFCVETSTSPGDYRRENDNIVAGKYRKELYELLNSNWNSCLYAIQQLPLIPDTVSHAISMSNLKELYDEEILSLHYHIFEGEEQPQHNLFEALKFADNSILTSIRSKKDSSNQRGHLTDHRFGFTFYYSFQIDKNSIKLVIRELDTLFFPPKKEHTYQALFKKKWFINYTYGYLQHLIECLQKEFTSGKVVLHRVFNHDCIITECSPHQENICHMNELGDYLILLGGTVEHVICESDPREGVALAFNSN